MDILNYAIASMSFCRNISTFVIGNKIKDSCRLWGIEQASYYIFLQMDMRLCLSSGPSKVSSYIHLFSSGGTSSYYCRLCPS